MNCTLGFKSHSNFSEPLIQEISRFVQCPISLAHRGAVYNNSLHPAPGIPRIIDGAPTSTDLPLAQRLAICSINSQSIITLIHGPPGTGKTCSSSGYEAERGQNWVNGQTRPHWFPSRDDNISHNYRRHKQPLACSQ